MLKQILAWLPASPENNPPGNLFDCITEFDEFRPALFAFYDKVRSLELESALSDATQDTKNKYREVALLKKQIEKEVHAFNSRLPCSKPDRTVVERCEAYAGDDLNSKLRLVENLRQFVGGLTRNYAKKLIINKKRNPCGSVDKFFDCVKDTHCRDSWYKALAYDAKYCALFVAGKATDAAESLGLKDPRKATMKALSNLEMHIKESFNQLLKRKTAENIRIAFPGRTM